MEPNCFPNGCTNVYAHSSVGVPSEPHLLSMIELLIFASLLGANLYLSVIVIYISLINNRIGHLYFYCGKKQHEIYPLNKILRYSTVLLIIHKCYTEDLYNFLPFITKNLYSLNSHSPFCSPSCSWHLSFSSLLL